MSASNTPVGAGAPGPQTGRFRASSSRAIGTSAELLDRAITRRNDWLGWALCTLPADRPSTEVAITALYALAGQDAPRFVWVDSPAAASTKGLIPEPPRLRGFSAPERAADWPLSGRLATLMSSLRHCLNERVRRHAPSLSSWPPHPAMHTARTFPPQESLLEGLGLDAVLQVTVRDTLHTSLHESVGGPLRTALAQHAGQEAGHASGLTWYGQHDAYWIAEHDIRRDLGMTYSDDDSAQLDLWAVLARSCGWWWPGEQVCVVSERPSTVHTEPVLGAVHGELRLHSGKGQAVTYPDGWGVHSWHGTQVPSWVITDPSVERIVAETNAEVRRCAIERIGWDTYIDQAGLDLVSVAPDPGNPGCRLELYDMPTRLWGAPVRVLLAVNGSVERDGHRRRYGLSVPADLDDPVAAAGWSYGLTGDLYARMLRRT